MHNFYIIHTLTRRLCKGRYVILHTARRCTSAGKFAGRTRQPLGCHCRQEKENSRKERAQARLVQQQQAPAVCEAPQEKVLLQLPTLGTPKGISLKGSSFFGSGRHQAAPNGTAAEPRTHYR